MILRLFRLILWLLSYLIWHFLCYWEKLIKFDARKQGLQILIFFFFEILHDLVRMAVFSDILLYVLHDGEVRTIESAILFNVFAFPLNILKLILRLRSELDKGPVLFVVNFDFNNSACKLWKLDCLLDDANPPFLESYFSLASVGQHIDLFLLSAHYVCNEYFKVALRFFIF